MNNERPSAPLGEERGYRNTWPGNTPPSQCISCSGSFTFIELITLDGCFHSLCHDCLRNYFQSSLQGLPRDSPAPRCCSWPIVFTDRAIRSVLGQELFGKVQLRQQERDTPNALYCHNQECKTFIPSPQAVENGVGSCVECRKQTCVLCREQAHSDGQTCVSSSPPTSEFADLAHRRGWKQCPTCRRFVERTEGCSEMGEPITCCTLLSFSLDNTANHRMCD